ncbi:MAG: hypothetical protein ABIG30_02875 [Candidatus Aenigmatarchaeota archaeon]
MTIKFAETHLKPTAYQKSGNNMAKSLRRKRAADRAALQQLVKEGLFAKDNEGNFRVTGEARERAQPQKLSACAGARQETPAPAKTYSEEYFLNAFRSYCRAMRNDTRNICETTCPLRDVACQPWCSTQSSSVHRMIYSAFRDVSRQLWYKNGRVIKSGAENNPTVIQTLKQSGYLR